MFSKQPSLRPSTSQTCLTVEYGEICVIVLEKKDSAEMERPPSAEVSADQRDSVLLLRPEDFVEYQSPRRPQSIEQAVPRQNVKTDLASGGARARRRVALGDRAGPAAADAAAERVGGLMRSEEHWRFGGHASETAERPARMDCLT